MRGNPALLTAMLCAGGVFAGSSAFADRGSFRGAHPIPAERPGNFCHIDSLHTHTYTPALSPGDEYLQHSESETPQLEFVGDPTGLGYEGPIFAYGEAHPLHFKGGSGASDEQCQVVGSHFHVHEPYDLSQFEDHKGTYYFGSYKDAMRARRTQEKLRRAEARERKQEERRLRATERSARRGPDLRSKTRGSREASPAITPPAVTETTKNTRTRAKNKSTAKSPNKGFRSWMDRRRGR